jgi:hypothetical protein
MSYSRVENVSFLIRTAKELKYICSKFRANDKKPVLVVRLKMMENLAKQSFQYLIAISYLTETEYIAIAEPIDDAFLYQSRIQLEYMANTHGRMVIGEYNAMRDTLELVDAQLKQISVFGTKRITKNKMPNPQQGTYWSIRGVGDGGTHVVNWKRFTNQQKHVEEEPKNPSTKPLQTNQNQNTTDADADKKYKDFRVRVLAFTNENYRLQTDTQMTPQIRLQLQCDNLRGMYEYIAANAEYISLEYRFREPSKTFADKASFMQLTIRKSLTIANEIRNRFAKVTENGPNPTLLESKNAVLNTIQHAKDELFKYYLRNPVEI